MEEDEQVELLLEDVDEESLEDDDDEELLAPLVDLSPSPIFVAVISILASSVCLSSWTWVTSGFDVSCTSTASFAPGMDPPFIVRATKVSVDVFSTVLLLSVCSWMDNFWLLFRPLEVLELLLLLLLLELELLLLLVVLVLLEEFESDEFVPAALVNGRCPGTGNGSSLCCACVSIAFVSL